MRYRFGAALAAAGFVLAAVPALAHHATQAEFDKDRQKTLTGVMTKVSWINPHVSWLLDVKDEQGQKTTWRIAGAGPGAFRANGVTGRGIFKVGETYTAIIALARDGSTTGYIMTWIMPDGTKMDFWHEYLNK